MKKWGVVIKDTNLIKVFIFLQKICVWKIWMCYWTLNNLPACTHKWDTTQCLILQDSKMQFLFSNQDPPGFENLTKPLLIRIYRHSSCNLVLLYRGIPSNAFFSKPISALIFYLTRFFQKKIKKIVKQEENVNKFFSSFFFKCTIWWYDTLST